MSKRKPTVTEIEPVEIVTRELDKTQMQLEIAHPEQVKATQAPIVFTIIAGDGRELWLVGLRKRTGGRNEDRCYQVHRPSGMSNEKMLLAVERVAERLAEIPKGIAIRDADLFDFEQEGGGK